VNAQDLLSSSFRLIGVLASGETMPADEAADGLVVLNQMLDSWNTERLMIFTQLISEFPLVPGQQVYTLGAGGNFNIPRPSRIERMSIVNLANPAQPLELPMEMLSDEDWQTVPVKVITSTLPLYVYDDGAFPLRNLSFYPVPQSTVNTRIYSWSSLLQFPDLTTDVTFPPGYLKAIRYNLAVDLIAEYPGEYSQLTVSSVTTQARETKAKLKRLNIPSVQSGIDGALVDPDGGYYDWRSDMPVGGTR
jgi:hypothetical protein